MEHELPIDILVSIEITNKNSRRLSGRITNFINIKIMLIVKKNNAHGTISWLCF
jgi:hypothetical protein